MSSGFRHERLNLPGIGRDIGARPRDAAADRRIQESIHSATPNFRGVRIPDRMLSSNTGFS